MHRIATYIIAFSLGSLAMGALAHRTGAQTPVPPPWLAGGPNAICDDSSPCNMPAETHRAFQVAIQWLEADGVTPCPAPPATEHPQTTCGPNPQIRHWLALSRGDVAWGPGAIDHDVLVSQGPVYSPATSGVTEFSGLPNNGRYAYGGVVTFTLPAAAVQAPALPVLDPTAWQAWFDSACANNSTCNAAAAPLTQAEFDTLLASSPYDAHAHPFTITVNSTPVNGLTGTPQ